jgi:hypothetical protein
MSTKLCRRSVNLRSSLLVARKKLKRLKAAEGEFTLFPVSTTLENLEKVLVALDLALDPAAAGEEEEDLASDPAAAGEEEDLAEDSVPALEEARAVPEEVWLLNVASRALNCFVLKNNLNVLLQLTNCSLAFESRKCILM